MFQIKPQLSFRNEIVSSVASRVRRLQEAISDQHSAHRGFPWISENSIRTRNLCAEQEASALCQLKQRIVEGWSCIRLQTPLLSPSTESGILIQLKASWFPLDELFLPLFSPSEPTFCIKYESGKFFHFIFGGGSSSTLRFEYNFESVTSQIT